MAVCGLGFLVREGRAGPSEHHCRLEQKPAGVGQVPGAAGQGLSVEPWAGQRCSQDPVVGKMCGLAR